MGLAADLYDRAIAQGPFPTDICISAANAYRQANRLPAVIRGDDKPKDAAERLALAYIAYYMEHFGASARLFTGPFQSDPQLAEDMTAQNRYNAACAAALAAAGKGNDKPPSEPQRPGGGSRPSTGSRRISPTGPSRPSPVRPRRTLLVKETLVHWKADADLAAIRDEQSLNSLPEDQQKACRSLWADVDMLLKTIVP